MASFIEKQIIKIAKKAMGKKLKFEEIPNIPKDDLIENNNVPYSTRDGGNLFMDIIKPNTNDKLPIIIYIHGGGLFTGQKETSTSFCRLLAKKGFVVFSLEYRLVPNVKVYDQINDIFSGMDFVKTKLSEYNADEERIYMASESAGSFLSLYVTAINNSRILQNAFNCIPSDITIRAQGLLSGMFYTKKKDEIGIFLSLPFYGNDSRNKDVFKYLNPEHEEIIGNIPPSYLVTSKNDFIENYTLEFSKRLTEKGTEHKLTQMGDDEKLIHAFPVLKPNYKESQFVIDEMIDWFNEH